MRQVKMMTDPNHPKMGDKNVVLFPKTVRRLLELGMERIEKGDGREAKSHFEEVLSYEPNNREAKYGLVLANIELGKLKVAKDFAEDLLKEGNEDYFEILQVYASLLFQLGEYGETTDLLEAVLSETTIPPTTAETLYQLLHMSRKMACEDQETRLMHNDTKSKDEPIIQLWSSGKPEKLWEGLTICPEIPSETIIQLSLDLLINEDIDPVFKTSLLEKMRKWQVDRPVEIVKFGQQLDVNLNSLPSPDEDPLYKETKQFLENIEDDDPTLYRLASDLWTHCHIIYYPFPLPKKSGRHWACAIHIVALERLGGEWTDELLNMYDMSKEEVSPLIETIESLEKQVPFDLIE